MLKQKDFLRYPPGTHIAQEEVDEDNKRLAVFGEWQRLYFRPALEKLGANGFSRRAARRVLHLSYDCLQFEEVMKRQRFYLPLQAEQQLRDTTIGMLTVAGEYWADYYSKFERGCLEGPLVAIEQDDMPAALRRFTKLKLDAFNLWVRLTLAARHPRYWLILRLALFHYFRDEGTWVSVEKGRLRKKNADLDHSLLQASATCTGGGTASTSWSAAFGPTSGTTVI